MRVSASARRATSRSSNSPEPVTPTPSNACLTPVSTGRIARRSLILRTDWDARDACQDAFASAWRELPRLRDPARFDAWLDRIVVNRCRTLLRRRKARVREISIDDAGDPSPELTGPSPIEALADEDLVRSALARLSPDQRLVLVLHHGEGRPVKEIASLIGVPSGTVMWRLYKARKALEKELREVSA